MESTIAEHRFDSPEAQRNVRLGIPNDTVVGNTETGGERFPTEMLTYGLLQFAAERRHEQRFAAAGEKGRLTQEGGGI